MFFDRREITTQQPHTNQMHQNKIKKLIRLFKSQLNEIYLYLK